MGGPFVGVGAVVALLLQAGSDEPRDLIGRVEGQAAVPLAGLRLAEREAERIFETGKVRLVWARPTCAWDGHKDDSRCVGSQC
jgi:hypothetical protein